MVRYKHSRSVSVNGVKSQATIQLCTVIDVH
nr:MAG TPA: hypothetical protein [Caudoviricetes sp.]